MTERRYQHLQQRMEGNVLILTMTAPELSNDDASDALRKEMVEAAATSGARCAVVDLSQVSYIASPGIRALLGFRRHFVEAGGRLILCQLNDMIRDVLNTARLIGATGSSPPVLFETAPDVAAGIAHLKATQPA